MQLPTAEQLLSLGHQKKGLSDQEGPRPGAARSVKKPCLAMPPCMAFSAHIPGAFPDAGTVEYPGRILIMTSNYPERLDKALVRKGRMNISLRMKKASAAITKEMYENFYDDKVAQAAPGDGL